MRYCRFGKEILKIDQEVLCSRQTRSPVFLRPPKPQGYEFKTAWPTAENFYFFAPAVYYEKKSKTGGVTDR